MANAVVVRDGNAFSFLAVGSRALKNSGREAEVEAFTAEMTSGDYENLIRTFLKWFPDAEIETGY